MKKSDRLKALRRSKPVRPVGRPYKLTPEQHRALVRAYAAGESVLRLAVQYGLNLKTAYAYIHRDPDAPRGGKP